MTSSALRTRKAASMATAMILRCACGKRRTKWAEQCRSCVQARLDTLHAEARRIVSVGYCPKCHTALIRNLALTGWYQCGAYAAEAHRQPIFAGLPQCSFQTFTD